MNIISSTPLIELATGDYPKYLNDVRLANPDVSFSTKPTEEFLATLGYAGVQATVQPAATDTQAVEQGAPVQIDGAYRQVWVMRDLTADELATALASAQAVAADKVDAARVATFNDLGMEYLFPDATVGHVQLGDTCRINLLTLQGAAMLLSQQGVTGPVLVFRDLENNGHTLTPEQCLEMCSSATQYGTALYQAGWNLKAQINAATKLAEIPEIPQYFSVPAP